MSHQNDGSCQKCKEIIERFSDFNSELSEWFYNLQKENNEVHTSCAGRKKSDQEWDLFNKRTKAKWGHSAHNYNMALDLFQLDENGTARFDPIWYIATIQSALTPNLLWYGRENAPYLEYPHVEIKGWNLDPNRKLING